MKRPNHDKINELRQELYEEIEAGHISLSEATKKMRRILGINRKDYAEKILNISFDALQDVETNQGNPTLKTLNAIGAPFGLVVGFRRKRID